MTETKRQRERDEEATIQMKGQRQEQGEKDSNKVTRDRVPEISNRTQK